MLVGYPSDLTSIPLFYEQVRGTGGLPLGSNLDTPVLGAGGVLVGYPSYLTLIPLF